MQKTLLLACCCTILLAGSSSAGQPHWVRDRPIQFADGLTVSRANVMLQNRVPMDHFDRHEPQSGLPHRVILTKQGWTTTNAPRR